MDHVDIEVAEGSILIFTDAGEMLELQVEPKSESVIKVMSSRPPSTVTVHGADDDADLVAALQKLGHEATATVHLESVF
jgi:hypothetical protein